MMAEHSQGWLLDASMAGDTEALLAERPELIDGYRAFLETLWRGQDPRLLTLCRRRIEAIHGAGQGWSPLALPALPQALDRAELEALQSGLTDANSALFTATERAALAIAELMPHGQHQISAAHTAALESALGAPQTIALLTAIAFFDVSTRLGLALAFPADALDSTGA